MKKFITNLGVCIFLFLTFIFPLITPNVVSASVIIKTKILDYHALCDVELENTPDSISFSSGRFELATCTQITQQYKNLKALTVSFNNTNDRELILKVNGLKDISLLSENGTKLYPVGIYLKSPYGNPANSYVVVMENTMTNEIKAGSTGEIIVLFEDIKIGDTLQIGADYVVSIQTVEEKEELKN